MCPCHSLEVGEGRRGTEKNGSGAGTAFSFLALALPFAAQSQCGHDRSKALMLHGLDPVTLQVRNGRMLATLELCILLKDSNFVFGTSYFEIP